jgi:hypothetical protein
VSKGTPGDPMAARAAGMAWFVASVTVGELRQWADYAELRSRTRDGLELRIGRVVVVTTVVPAPAAVTAPAATW